MCHYSAIPNTIETGGQIAASDAAEDVFLGHRKHNWALLDLSDSCSPALTILQSIEFELKSTHHTHSPAGLRDITTLWAFLFLSCSKLLQEGPWRHIFQRDVRVDEVLENDGSYRQEA